MSMEDGHEDGDGGWVWRQEQRTAGAVGIVASVGVCSSFAFFPGGFFVQQQHQQQQHRHWRHQRQANVAIKFCLLPSVFFFFLFFCFFLERHILMMSRVESPCHRFTTNSDSELASISCGCCCNKGNANLCVSLWMLFLGLALNTLVYRVADRERGICFRSLGGMGKNSLRFLA